MAGLIPMRKPEWMRKNRSSPGLPRSRSDVRLDQGGVAQPMVERPCAAIQGRAARIRALIATHAAAALSRSPDGIAC